MEYQLHSLKNGIRVLHKKSDANDRNGGGEENQKILGFNVPNRGVNQDEKNR